jgi:NADH:ubiquinone oxidoreductase subunit D
MDEPALSIRARHCWRARRSKMIVGGLIADVIAVIGSIDVVMGAVDR